MQRVSKNRLLFLAAMLMAAVALFTIRAYATSACAALSIADGSGSAVNQSSGQVQGLTPGNEATFALQSTSNFAALQRWTVQFFSPNCPALNGKSFAWDPSLPSSAVFSVKLPLVAFSASYVSTIYDQQSNVVSQYTGVIVNLVPVWTAIGDGGTLTITGTSLSTYVMCDTGQGLTQNIMLPAAAVDGQEVVVSEVNTQPDGGCVLNPATGQTVMSFASGGSFVDTGTKMGGAGSIRGIVFSAAKASWVRSR
jgi:hypothetical protein